MMTRLQFLRSLGQLGLAAVAVPVLVNCKSEDNEPPGVDAGMADANASGTQDSGPTMPPACDTVNANIGGNHGHTIVVSADDVAAGVEKTYQIQGTSPHPHTVVVTAAHFATLKATGSVTVESSVDAAHSHPVTITCPS